MSNLHKVAIVGRVNVGKSTLFNKLISANKAIVSRVAGTTRDRNYAICSWRDRDFYLIDTGGLLDNDDFVINKKISQQAWLAITESDIVLLVVDAKTGLMPPDKKLARQLEKIKKPVILVVNKTDNNRLATMVADFYQLNIGEPWLVSAANGLGTGDLLDEVVRQLKKIKITKKRKTPAIATKENIRVSIVGKPNVGKSSIVNAILGEERLITSPWPHTTRDSQDIIINHKDKQITLVDTAGLRRRSRKSRDPFEKQSVEQSLQSIIKSDIMILVTAANEDLTWQDKHLLNEAIEKRTGIIILANKWDTIPDKDVMTSKKFEDYYSRSMPFISWVPIVFTSATKKIRMNKIIPTILSVYEERKKIITDNALNKLLKQVLRKHKPTRSKGTKNPYIYSLKQTQSNPPVFSLKINFKASLADSYVRFIEKNIRYKFGFSGIPLKILFQKSQNYQDKK